MKILITGVTGFIGSSLFKKLLTEEHEIKIIIRQTSHLFRIQNFIKEENIIYSNYSDFKDCESEIIKFDPQIVYHIGWLGVDNSKYNDVNIFTQNIKSTLSLVEILTRCNIKVFIGLGSQAEYGPYNCVINEKHAANPKTLYGIAKLSAYNIFKYYFTDNNIRFIWLRLFSSYGPNDNPNWLIPYTINTLAIGKSPSLTKGEQIWDYIYIDDVINAIIACANTINTNGIYNLGSGIGYSLKSIITEIRDIINPNISLVFGEIKYRTDQIMVLQADNTRLKLDTGWKPNIEIHEGLKITINWFLNNLK